MDSTYNVPHYSSSSPAMSYFFVPTFKYCMASILKLIKFNNTLNNVCLKIRHVKPKCTND
jgi:hypothetical protein